MFRYWIVCLVFCAHADTEMELIRAIHECNIVRVEALIADGANVNVTIGFQQYTPLMIAVMDAIEDIVHEKRPTRHAVANAIRFTSGTMLSAASLLTALYTTEALEREYKKLSTSTSGLQQGNDNFGSVTATPRPTESGSSGNLLRVNSGISGGGSFYVSSAPRTGVPHIDSRADRGVSHLHERRLSRVTNSSGSDPILDSPTAEGEAFPPDDGSASSTDIPVLRVPGRAQWEPVSTSDQLNQAALHVTSARIREGKPSLLDQHTVSSATSRQIGSVVHEERLRKGQEALEGIGNPLAGAGRVVGSAYSSIKGAASYVASGVAGTVESAAHTIAGRAPVTGDVIKFLNDLKPEMKNTLQEMKGAGADARALMPKVEITFKKMNTFVDKVDHTMNGLVPKVHEVLNHATRIGTEANYLLEGIKKDIRDLKGIGQKGTRIGAVSFWSIVTLLCAVGAYAGFSYASVALQKLINAYSIKMAMPKRNDIICLLIRAVQMDKQVKNAQGLTALGLVREAMSKQENLPVFNTLDQLAQLLANEGCQ